MGMDLKYRAKDGQSVNWKVSGVQLFFWHRYVCSGVYFIAYLIYSLTLLVTTDELIIRAILEDWKMKACLVLLSVLRTWGEFKKQLIFTRAFVMKLERRVAILRFAEILEDRGKWIAADSPLDFDLIPRTDDNTLVSLNRLSCSTASEMLGI